MIQRFLLSTICGGLVIFVLAAVSFGFLFSDFFSESLPAEFAGIERSTPRFALIVLADFLYAGLLAFLLGIVGRVRTFWRGALVGMVLGFGVVLHFDLIRAATTHLTTPPSIAANVAISAVMSGVGAGVVAAVWGRLERA